ncbi:Dynamin-2 [Manis pentadactyla]|nr:Dynamin-2 [Manis pentadactyla]
MRSGAEARSRWSLDVGFGPGFSELGWDVRLLPETRSASRGSEVAGPKAPPRSVAEPATQAPVPPPPLLPRAFRAAPAARRLGPSDSSCNGFRITPTFYFFSV